MYRMTRIRFRPFKNAQIRWFIRRYGVDMGDAVAPDPASYPDFNHFFTRALKPQARPIPADPDFIVSPADGMLSSFGSIRAGTLFQAKGQSYTLDALLAGDHRLSSAFKDGSYATIYLAPRDYHRVHCPADGHLTRAIYVPGEFFSVNPKTVAQVPAIFARNERVIFDIETNFGPMAVIMVGAVCVSSVSTQWDGEITGSRGGPSVRDYHPTPALVRGDELARFNMGSTVVAIFPPDTFTWEVEEPAPYRCNEALARRRPSRTT